MLPCCCCNDIDCVRHKKRRIWCAKNCHGAEYFTVPLKPGPKYTLSVNGMWFVVDDSGTSRGLFRRRGMFKSYTVLVDDFDYTASEGAICVI